MKCIYCWLSDETVESKTLKPPVKILQLFSLSYIFIFQWLSAEQFDRKVKCVKNVHEFHVIMFCRITELLSEQRSAGNWRLTFISNMNNSCSGRIQVKEMIRGCSLILIWWLWLMTETQSTIWDIYMSQLYSVSNIFESSNSDSGFWLQHFV